MNAFKWSIGGKYADTERSGVGFTECSWVRAVDFVGGVGVAVVGDLLDVQREECGERSGILDLGYVAEFVGE